MTTAGTTPPKNPQGTPHLSVVIPAYNEERRLPAPLKSVLGWLEDCPHSAEVILVDDGSTDQTVARAEEVFNHHSIPYQILHNEPNRGKGYSVRKGLAEARGDLRLFTDADLSTPIEELVHLQEAVDKGYDLAIGSRALRESRVEIHQNWFRERMGKTFNLLVQLFALRGIHDTQCGFKILTASAARSVLPYLTIDGWAFDVEMLFVARKLGLRIAEVPVRWRNDENTRVNALSDSVNMFLELLKVRWNDLRGAYRTTRGETQS